MHPGGQRDPPDNLGGGLQLVLVKPNLRARPLGGGTVGLSVLLVVAAALQVLAGRGRDERCCLWHKVVKDGDEGGEVLLLQPEGTKTKVGIPVMDETTAQLAWTFSNSESKFTKHNETDLLKLT